MAEKFGVLFENIQYNLKGAFIKISNSIHWQNNIIGKVTLQILSNRLQSTSVSLKFIHYMLAAIFFLPEKKR